MTKRYISLFLALILIFSLCPVAAFADSSMTVSDDMIYLIKQFEGSKTETVDGKTVHVGYADPIGIPTIGYGHTGTVDGTAVYVGMRISEEKALELLRLDLADAEKAVNQFFDKYNIQVDYPQFVFDGLVSLAFNAGTAYLEKNPRILRYLKNGTYSQQSELEIVDAMVATGLANGKPLPGLATRRIAEAEVMLYGEYDLNDTGFAWVILDNCTNSSGNAVQAYAIGSAYGTLPTPEAKDGYSFSGWKKSDGTYLKASDTVTGNLHLTGVWTSTSVSANNCPYYGADCPSASMTDVKLDWAHADIDYCIENGIFAGTSSTTFSPDIPVTRAMFVTVLYNLEGKPTATGSSEFTDLSTTQTWYHNAVIWGGSNNIVAGTGNGLFQPDVSVSREQIAVFLFRYANYKYYNTNYSADLSSFPDGSSTSAWADEAMSWAVKIGLIYGVSVNGQVLLDPQGTATRAQAAAIIHRFAEYYGIFS